MQKRSSQWFIPVVLAIGAAAALWYYWAKVSEPVAQPATAMPAIAEEPAETLGPLHPFENTDSAVPAGRNLVPLPPLDRSDEYFKLEISGIYGESINELLAETGMIERVVATIDNLPRAHVAERIRPIGRIGSQFLVDGQDGSGEYTINTENYSRYDLLVQVATEADLHEVTDLYRRFYPLFQSAYVNLGYPDGYFNDRLVEVIDHLLATPEVSDPVALVRPHVLYEYRDTDLEALSSGQKLLLRMGNEHAVKIRQTLTELRALITSM